MYSEENCYSNTASIVSSVVDRNDEIIASTSELKEEITYHNLDETKGESLTMDASFLYENDVNQCMYTVAPQPASSFLRQYPSTPSMHYLNYTNMPYNYGYNFMQQPNYIYSHHAQNNMENHNSVLSISEGSAFTPLRPKYFSPRLVNMNENDAPTDIKGNGSLKVVGSGKKRTQFGSVPTVSETISSTTTQSVQLKEIQEMLSNNQIPIVSIC